MPNEKHKQQNRNPFDLVRLYAGDKFDIFKHGFGSKRLYDHRINKSHSKKNKPQEEGE